MGSEGTVKTTSRARKTTPKRSGIKKAVKQVAAVTAAVASLTWSTACPDWEQRIVARESLIPCAPLFPDAAKQGMDVFNALKLVDVMGEPTIGESCRPWLKDFAASFFGSYDPDTGVRHINEFFLLVSKKNTKSTIAAGVMLTQLVLNWRRSAEFLILAPTK